MGCGTSASISPQIQSRTTVIPILPETADSIRTAVRGRPGATTLMKPELYRHPTPLTMGDLNNRRNEFWATRTDGNIHMWQAIRCAAEALLLEDLVLARAILEASDMMTARGSLELCYDEFNRAYRTPLFCFTNPDNLIDMNSPPKIISKGLDFLKSCSQSTFCPQPINLKLRVNPGDFNLRILMSTSDSISDLKHFIYEQSVKADRNMDLPILEEQRQRILYMGRELHDSQLLGDVGADESKVMQVFLRPLPHPLPPSLPHPLLSDDSVRTVIVD